MSGNIKLSYGQLITYRKRLSNDAPSGGEVAFRKGSFIERKYPATIHKDAEKKSHRTQVAAVY